MGLTCCGSYSPITSVVRRLPEAAHNRREDVVGRAVEGLLRGVETQTVKVEFIDPVAGVGEKKSAYRPAFLPSKLAASPHSFS